jgi:bile acid:Na+ symporter, BASS family
MINEKRLRNWTLPFAILCGLLFHNHLYSLYPSTPYLLFGMMFFTCTKISISEMKIRPIHIYLLMVQVLAGCGIYYLLKGFDESVAQGLMICIFTPVAIASPVVGGLLGADVTLMTTFVLLSNITAAILAPIFFTLITSGNDIPFFASFMHIISKTLILLVLPLVLSWFINRFTPNLHNTIKRYHHLSFYLWAICMMILIGSTFHSIFSSSHNDYKLELIMAFGALIICLLQFFFGKKLGIHYKDMPAGRQMMGQKNTGIGIWLTISFLNPLASVAPAAYIIWQNLMNSLEIWLESNKKQE